MRRMFVQGRQQGESSPEIRVSAEHSIAAGTILGQAAALRWPTFTVPAGETQKLTVKAQEQPRKE